MIERFICVGVNHRHTPVELREQVAFAKDKLPSAVQAMVQLPALQEGIIVNTCNRVELYAMGDPDAASAQLKNFLHQFHGIRPSVLDTYLFSKTGEEAVQHLFRVASSLDAIVVGEPQILGQVKDAFSLAAAQKTAGSGLHRVFHRAFTAAKRVRTETKIAASAVSVSYAGVELARKIFDDLSGLMVVLVGAGEMGELAARHFVEKGTRIIVANRSLANAHQLAEQYGGVARDLVELPSLLEDADIVLVSTGAPLPIITKEMAQRAAKRRRYRPLFLIDISVPRNVANDVSDVEGMYVYDVDDLGQVVEENLEARKTESLKAESIVKDEVKKFVTETQERNAAPTIRALREKMLGIASQEANRTLSSLGDAINDKQKKSVMMMAQSIVAKILHEPIAQMKANKNNDDNAVDLLAAVQTLFAIDIEDTAQIHMQPINAQDAQKIIDAAEDAIESMPESAATQHYEKTTSESHAADVYEQQNRAIKTLSSVSLPSLQSSVRSPVRS